MTRYQYNNNRYMKKTIACLIAIMLSAMVAASFAAEKIYDISEVTVIRTDSGFKYAYRDSSGQLIVQDVPPPGYLESLTRERAKQDEIPDVVDEPVGPLPVAHDEPTPLIKPAMWALAVLLALFSAYVFFTPLLRRWRSESRLERALRHAGFPVFADVELAVNEHRTTRIDCLARTPAGVLVLGDVHFSGNVTGEPHHDFWMQKARSDVRQIDNPLRKNARDTKTVQALLGSVPVHGQVVYTGNAELPASLKLRLHKLSEFAENLNEFETETPDQRSLAGGWRTLMRYPRANRVTVRPMGAGWKRWLHDRWRPIVSISLLASSVTIMTVLLVLRWLNGA